MRHALFAVLIATSSPAAPPKLGVLIVIDQLDAETFAKRLPATKGGIARLAAQGLRFTEARYEVAPTLTSAGHATLATGTWASVHGVVSNEWVDWATGRSVLSTEDKAFQVLGRPTAKQDGTAPTFLQVPTLGDSMKVNDARAKVVAISGKDRSAMLLAGRSADAVLWFDSDRPMFTSSTFYATELPAFVAAINQKIDAALQAKRFSWSGEGRDGDNEPNAEQPELQPLVDAWEVDLALAAVKGLSLGADDAPDLLCISFSGHDRIGHTFGGDGPESLAEFMAVDRELARLLDGLDAAVGKGAWVAALSADHGVAPVPEKLKERRVDAGRIDLKALRLKLEQKADELLGPGDWFAGSKTPGLTSTAAGRVKLATIAEPLRELAMAQPGIADLFTVARLNESKSPTAELWRRGFFAGRSPDFIVVAKPYWIYSVSDTTGHASHWLYDRSVPLVISGAGVRVGRAGLAEAIDVAPTLARLLGVPAPAGSQGRALEVSR